MCILLIPLILGALCSIQLVLAFATTPLLGFSVTVAQLLVASFFLNPWLLGNYLMLARSNLVIANGVAVNNGALLSLAIIIASIVLGGHLFARRDILGRESDAS